MTFDGLPDAVEALLQEVHALRAEQLAMREGRLQEWFTLHAACELKGVSYHVVRKRPMRYWPARGRGHAVINNDGHYSRMYHRSEVMEWLPLTEEDIDAEIRRENREATGRKAS